jgi:hypothetical protein
MDRVNLNRPHEFFRLAGLTHHRHRGRDRYPQTQGRYPPAGPYVCYALLNGGLLARIAGEAWWSASASPLGAALFALSTVAQTLAVIVFARIAWERVRPPAHPAPGVR